ncbi:MAG: prolipoprotein diacylglyceryl transferase [Acidimicrobiia bacterium]|nr:prolipoprotein diacylglyceryl transferase [Acidimicrobiia bacterium]
MEFTLLWAALTGVAGLYGALWLMGRRDTSLCVRDLWDAAITAAVVGLAVGRIVAMVRGGVNPLTNPGDILLVRAGVDTVGATLAALAALAWVLRADLAEQLDGLAPAALAGIAGWHGGCLFRDACLGTPSDLPWAWAQSGSTITRHPVELYAALAFFLVAGGLFRLRLRYPPPGVVAGLGLAVAGVVRLATEPLRPSLLDGPTAWYAAAAVLGGATAAWSWQRSRAGQRRPDGPLQ